MSGEADAMDVEDSDIVLVWLDMSTKYFVNAAPLGRMVNDRRR
jgi:hypothetical protein